MDEFVNKFLEAWEYRNFSKTYHSRFNPPTLPFLEISKLNSGKISHDPTIISSTLNA